MNEPHILIIGAGVAGLSAGCYARMNGYRATIFELHSIPGGLCTSWKRRGYLFDGAIRYLTGAGEGVTVHQLWDELGALDGKQIHFYDEFSCFEAADGRTFHLYTDIDRLEAHMLALSPQDAGLTAEFIAGLRDFTHMDLPVDPTPTEPLEGLDMGQRMLPLLAPILKWKDVSIREFAARFDDPLLREALPEFFQFSPPDFPMMLMMVTLASMHTRTAGYPIGGSLAFAEGLAHRLHALGGEIVYEARVVEIIVENDTAVGVRLEDGRELRGDIVISAGDGRSAIFDLLGGRYLDEKIIGYYRDLTAARPILQISLGVQRDFSAAPPMHNFPLKREIWIGDRAYNRLVVKHYNFDPTAAPAGKSALTLWMEADYAYWKALRDDDDAYRAAKSEAAEKVIAALDEHYPGLAAEVEIVDVATPVTFERYTANWRGSIAGWAMTSRKMSMMMGTGMRKTLPGLDNFYMIGQWVEPGGNVELSAASGRDVIKDLCKLAGKLFETGIKLEAKLTQ